MSTRAVRPPQPKWVPVAVIAGVAVAGGIGFTVFKPRPVSVPLAKAGEVLAVPAGEAGKVGDLQVSPEALDLAKITIAPATNRLVSEKITVSGVVQAGGDDLVKVTPRVPGKVVRLLAQAGDTVRAGEVLAMVESTELGQAQAAYRLNRARVASASESLKQQRQLARLGQFGRPAVEEARSRAAEVEKEAEESSRSLADERAKLAEAEGDVPALASKVTQAEAELEVAKNNYYRADTLFKEQLVSRQEVERAKADQTKAEADVAVAKAGVVQGEARVAGAQARVAAAEREVKAARDRVKVHQQASQREETVYKGQLLTSREIVQAESALREARVEAEAAADAVRLLGGTPGSGNTFALASPISGRVQERTITLGETIDPEHAAFTVVNLDQVWAQLAIAPADLPGVRTGDRVELTSESAPGKTFLGTILSVGTQTDETTRTVAVRTTLSNASHLLKPGSYVNGTVVTDVRKERVTVPIAALQEHTGRPTVYVSLGTPGAFEVRHVRLGTEGKGWREISEGLKPGEKVAGTGTFYLKSEALKSSLSDGCCAP